jgi:hypothetical protein
MVVITIIREIKSRWSRLITAENTWHDLSLFDFKLQIPHFDNSSSPTSFTYLPHHSLLIFSSSMFWGIHGCWSRHPLRVTFIQCNSAVVALSASMSWSWVLDLVHMFLWTLAVLWPYMFLLPYVLLTTSTVDSRWSGYCTKHHYLYVLNCYYPFFMNLSNYMW